MKRKCRKTAASVVTSHNYILVVLQELLNLLSRIRKHGKLMDNAGVVAFVIWHSLMREGI